MKRLMNVIRMLPGWTSSASVRGAWIFLMMVMMIALFGPLLSNEKPYYCKLEGQGYFPLFSGIAENQLSNAHPAHSPVSWRNTKFEAVWRAPVPYSFHTLDLQTGVYARPLASREDTRYRHWLGTDALGRDVLAGMIRGCRVSLMIGLGSMLIALMIGVPLGALGAWWGNKDLKGFAGQWVVALISVLLIIYVWLTPLQPLYKWLVTIILLTVALWSGYRWHHQYTGRFSVPFDRMVMGVISIIDGFPAIFLILVLVAVLPVKGWVVIMGIIALLRWPSMARYMRAEVFKMKEANYIKAVRILNVPPMRILRLHIIPFAFRPVMISFIFGVASAILAESALSFLGIGLPAEEMNWGRLLAQARNHFEAWWLVVFPGCAIFFTLLSLYTIGNEYQKEVRM